MPCRDPRYSSFSSSTLAIPASGRELVAQSVRRFLSALDIESRPASCVTISAFGGNIAIKRNRGSIAQPLIFPVRANAEWHQYPIFQFRAEPSTKLPKFASTTLPGRIRRRQQLLEFHPNPLNRKPVQKIFDLGAGFQTLRIRPSLAVPCEKPEEPQYPQGVFRIRVSALPMNRTS